MEFIPVSYTHLDVYKRQDKGKMTVRFWRPVMKNGVIQFLKPEECTEKRSIREMEMKEFGTGNFTGLKEFSGEEVAG